ncbi:MAG TPA: hypothetical protein VFM55_14530 [Micromonosporaceae bacterium]|nr:hypothetical protein [Micromonosporaceae bacterium]
MTRSYTHNAGIVRPAVAGFGGALIGAVVGLVVGANIGGNWFTSFSIAGQQGYEATGLVGAVVGAVALGATGLWQGLRHQR